MSDLLSDVMEQSGLDGYGVAAELLQDVREALRNPTDEQVRLIAADPAVGFELRQIDVHPDDAVRAVLAAAAGQGVGGRP